MGLHLSGRANLSQWNSSNQATNGTEESVHIREVSVFQRLLLKLSFGKENVSLDYVWRIVCENRI